MATLKGITCVKCGVEVETVLVWIGKKRYVAGRCPNCNEEIEMINPADLIASDAKREGRSNVRDRYKKRAL